MRDDVPQKLICLFRLSMKLLFRQKRLFQFDLNVKRNFFAINTPCATKLEVTTFTGGGKKKENLEKRNWK